MRPKGFEGYSAVGVTIDDVKLPLCTMYCGDIKLEPGNHNVQLESDYNRSGVNPNVGFLARLNSAGPPLVGGVSNHFKGTIPFNAEAGHIYAIELRINEGGMFYELVDTTTKRSLQKGMFPPITN
jgi:hypothetical protein